MNRTSPNGGAWPKLDRVTEPALRDALVEVAAALPAAVRADLSGDDGFLVCDVEAHPGRPMTVPVAGPGIGRPGRSVVLKRSLAARPADFIRWVIAHELAHAYLRNEGRTPHEDPEAAADGLAAAWGFPRPSRLPGMVSLPVVRPPEALPPGATHDGDRNAQNP